MQVETVGLFFFGTMLIAAILIVASATLFTVKRQTVAIVERFGRFVRTAPSGLHVKIPFFEQIAGIVDLRIQQSEVKVETKTADNIFSRITISVQYHALPEKAYDAFFCLENAELKINSYVSGAVGAMVPKMNLSEVFKSKDDISSNLLNELRQLMGRFGYSVLMPVVTSIRPGAKVSMSSDDISTVQRLRLARANPNERPLIEQTRHTHHE